MRMQTLITGVVFVVMPFAAPSQASTAQHIAFEVATVKPSSAEQQPSVNFTLGPGDTYADTGGLLATKGINLLDYIRFAYKLSDGQVELLRRTSPDWVNTERFDVMAKSSRPHPSKDDMRTMMRSFLADRFALQVHNESQNIPVLALVQIRPKKTGASLQPHSATDTGCALPSSDSSRPSVASTPQLCGGLRSTGVPNAPSRVRLRGSAVSMASLAAQLGQMGGFTRPVIDATGLTGTYDFTLEWGPDAATEPTDETSRESYLQEALRKQLGMKLDRRTAPFQVVLIDHINRQPSQN